MGKVITDNAMHHHAMDKKFSHIVLPHYKEYVKNDLENVWILMKRDYKGVYHHGSKKYLTKYLNEFTFRFD